jgi:hypothetical protein
MPSGTGSVRTTKAEGQAQAAQGLEEMFPRAIPSEENKAAAELAGMAYDQSFEA